MLELESFNAIRDYLLQCLSAFMTAQNLKARCNGDRLRAGKSSWPIDYRVSDRQQDGKEARF